jgi:hypothetical protein
MLPERSSFCGFLSPFFKILLFLADPFFVVPMDSICKERNQNRDNSDSQEHGDSTFSRAM